jgi:hypothetical protein
LIRDAPANARVRQSFHDTAHTIGEIEKPLTQVKGLGEPRLGRKFESTVMKRLRILHFALNILHFAFPR